MLQCISYIYNSEWCVFNCYSFGLIYFPDEISSKEAQHCDTLERTKAELQKKWQEMYKEWMGTTEAKITELQAANDMMRRMLQQTNPNVWTLSQAVILLYCSKPSLACLNVCCFLGLTCPTYSRDKKAPEQLHFMSQSKQTQIHKHSVEVTNSMLHHPMSRSCDLQTHLCPCISIYYCNMHATQFHASCFIHKPVS